MTELLFRHDPYLQEAEATVLSVEENGAIVLDRTVFYPRGGGQPGDSGALRHASGASVTVQEAIYAPDRTTVLHPTAPEHATQVRAGDKMTAAIDWDKRFARMRIHTAMHLLTVVLPYPVTGGAVGDGEGRVDFDLPAEGTDRSAVEAELNALIGRDAPVTTRWISDEELLANPGLVKTMSVKPPMGFGQVRLVQIGDIDLQPCGGTHVAMTREIGHVAVTGIEKKGKQNRRVRIKLA